MLLISKKYASYKVLVDKETKVVPLESPAEVEAVAKAIARSLTSLLCYKLKLNHSKDAEELAAEYLQGLGFTVRNVQFLLKR